MAQRSTPSLLEFSIHDIADVARPDPNNKFSMKTWQVFISAGLTFLAVSLLVFADVSRDSLVGTYSVEEHGKRKEFVRVQERGGKYFISEKHGQTWGREDELRPIPPQDYMKIFGPNWKDAHPTGLQHDGFAILRVKPGWKMEGFHFVCETGYMAFVMMLGPIQLYKE